MSDAWPPLRALRHALGGIQRSRARCDGPRYQGADRSCLHLHVARCFYIAGRLGSGLYDPFDPAAADRPLDDKRYAIDHFQTKLFKLAEGFQTETGRRLAAARDKSLREFLSAFMDEI